MIQAELSRRHALIAGMAALPALGAASRPALAAAGPLGPALPGFQRFRLGGFEVVPLLAGARISDKPQETFGLNAPPEEFAALAERNFIPADRIRNSFTPVLVNTGAALVLFDTGLEPAGIAAALAGAGYGPEQVDLVVLTHMHGDHIGGLMGEGPTFPNASYVTGAVEYDHWAKAGNEGFDAKVRPLAERMAMVKGGDSALPGLTAIEAFGHTPGHMAWRVESEGQALILTADTANHYVFSLQRPDWEVRFDADKAQAAATRRSLLGMIAADRLPFIGYHMPFPAMGFLEAAEGGFRMIPATYQFQLDA